MLLFSIFDKLFFGVTNYYASVKHVDEVCRIPNWFKFKLKNLKTEHIKNGSSEQ